MSEIALTPATVADRAMIHDWFANSDISDFLHLPGEARQTFEGFCRDWEANGFTHLDPRDARMFLISLDDEPVGVIAQNTVDQKNRIEIDIWLKSEAMCGKGTGSKAVAMLSDRLEDELGVTTFMMQPTAQNPRAIRAYEKAGFVRQSATAAEIAAEWGHADFPDSVLMIREKSQGT